MVFDLGSVVEEAEEEDTDGVEDDDDDEDHRKKLLELFLLSTSLVVAGVGWCVLSVTVEDEGAVAFFP